MSAHLHPHIVCEAPRGIVHRVEREVVDEGVAVAPVVLQPDESGEWVALECGLAAAVTGQQDAAPDIYRWGWSPCCWPPCCTIPASAAASTPHHCTALTISCTTQGRPAAMAVRSSCTAASSCAADSASEVPGGGRCRNLRARMRVRDKGEVAVPHAVHQLHCRGSDAAADVRAAARSAFARWVLCNQVQPSTSWEPPAAAFNPGTPGNNQAYNQGEPHLQLRPSTSSRPYPVMRVKPSLQ